MADFAYLRNAMAGLMGLAVAGNGSALAEDIDQDAVPHNYPQPDYPPQAAYYDVPGYCETRFSVSETGVPIEIEVACTHPIFCQPVVVAMQDVSFSPAIRDGQASKRSNVVWPVSFGFNVGQSEPDIMKRMILPCQSAAIS